MFSEREDSFAKPTPAIAHASGGLCFFCAESGGLLLDRELGALGELTVDENVDAVFPDREAGVRTLSEQNFSDLTGARAICQIQCSSEGSGEPGGMDSLAPVASHASVTMRCDPWGPVLARLAFCLVCGGIGIDNAMTFRPWASGNEWLDGLLGVGLIGAGIWGVIGWLSSWLTIDRADNRLLLKRFTFWDIDGGQPRVIPLEAIDAVVLTPQRRAQLLLPNRIELRLKDGEKVPVSTICSMMWGMAIQAQRIADAIDCRYEEQEEPDKKKS